MGIQIRLQPVPGFPAQEVERCIRDLLNDQADVQEALRPRPTSACEPEIDSLVVVEIICAIEEVTGVTLPQSFVPRGGYQDTEACVEDLVSKTRSVWPHLVKEEEHHE